MPVSINNETYYTAGELASKFNVRVETIRRWRLYGGLPSKAIGTGKRKFIFRESDIEKFLSPPTQGE